TAFTDATSDGSGTGLPSSDFSVYSSHILSKSSPSGGCVKRLTRTMTSGAAMNAGPPSYISSGGKKYHSTDTRGPTIMPQIAPHVVTPFQKRERMTGGPKHDASPSPAKSASRNPESSGFSAMMMPNPPMTAVAILETRMVFPSSSSPLWRTLFHKSSAIVDDAISSIESMEDIIADSAPASTIPAIHHGRSSTVIVGKICSGFPRSGNSTAPDMPMNEAP